MKVWGLTGGVGMGKSTTAGFLRIHGAQVVDTDDLAHQLVQPGELALAEIQDHFGQAVIAADGRLRRAELARIVFADPVARKKLEGILHPKIHALWLAQIEIWRGHNCQLAVVVIPLLYETQAESQFDRIICVACSAEKQHQRLLARGWSIDQIQQRIDAQMPVEQKIARADFVIWTDGELDSHRQQLERILSKH